MFFKKEENSLKGFNRFQIIGEIITEHEDNQ